MMGAPGQKGLIPRICDELFERINQVSGIYSLLVSYRFLLFRYPTFAFENVMSNVDSQTRL